MPHCYCCCTKLLSTVASKMFISVFPKMFPHDVPTEPCGMGMHWYCMHLHTQFAMTLSCPSIAKKLLAVSYNCSDINILHFGNYTPFWELTFWIFHSKKFRNSPLDCHSNGCSWQASQAAKEKEAHLKAAMHQLRDRAAWNLVNSDIHWWPIH